MSRSNAAHVFSRMFEAVFLLLHGWFKNQDRVAHATTPLAMMVNVRRFAHINKSAGGLLGKNHEYNTRRRGQR
jgi:hypothetical protein